MTTSSSSGVYSYRASLHPYYQSYYKIRTLSNQYALTEFDGSFTESTAPTIIPLKSRAISIQRSSILPIFSEVGAPGLLSGSGLILWTGSTKTVTLPDQFFEMSFAS